MGTSCRSIRSCGPKRVLLPLLLLSFLLFNGVPSAAGELAAAGGRYVLAASEAWQESPLSEAEAGLLLRNEAANLWLLFCAEELDGVTLTSFDDYFMALAMGITGSELFENVRLTAASDRQLPGSGLLCREIGFDAHFTGDGGAEITGRIAAISFGEGRCGQVFAWAESENGDLLLRETEGILDSLRVEERHE